MGDIDSYSLPVPLIQVEIVYGKTGCARVIRREVPSNATLKEAIEQSGILEMYPEINLDSNKVGIFSRKRELHASVRAGDRIEIYQPLKADPKEARRRRAKKAD